MYNTVKTIWHVKLESFRASKQPFAADPNSTLNEFFNIRAGAALPAGKYPDVTYLCIGRGGHKAAVAAGNEDVYDPQQPRCNAARLFKHLPFVVRPVTNDLGPAEREKYRLRRMETHGGINYFVYYARKVELSNQPPVIERVTVTNGIVNRTPYVPSADQLAPAPVSVINGKVNNSTGEHLVVSTPISVTLTKADIAEIINACEIIYKDQRVAEITEVALVSGIDDTATSNDGGQAVTYTDILAAQCCNFIGTSSKLLYQSERLDFSFRMSGSVPYLV